VRFAGRRRTECTSEDRKSKQTAADHNFQHAADRQSEQKQTTQEQEQEARNILTKPLKAWGDNR